MTSGRSAPRTRIAILEDDRATRDLLVTYFQAQGGTEIVGAYSSRLECTRDSAAAAADVLVFDYRLGDGTGLDALRELREQGVRSAAVLFSADPELRIQQSAAEVDAFVGKDQPLPVLLAAVRRLAEQPKAP